MAEKERGREGEMAAKGVQKRGRKKIKIKLFKGKTQTGKKKKKKSQKNKNLRAQRDISFFIHSSASEREDRDRERKGNNKCQRTRGLKRERTERFAFCLSLPAITPKQGLLSSSTSACAMRALQREQRVPN